MAQDRKNTCTCAGYAGLQTVTKLQKRYQQKKQKLRLLIK